MSLTDEARTREALATYFLQHPTAAPRDCIDRLDRLLTLEWESLLCFIGHERPLFSGDLAALVRALAAAVTPWLASCGSTLTLDVPHHAIRLAYEPRRLPLALAKLVRLAAQGQTVSLSVRTTPAYATLYIRADRPFTVSPYEDGLREIARLHGGRLLCTDRTAVLSLSRTKKAVGEAPSPTASASSAYAPFALGFYGSLV